MLDRQEEDSMVHRYDRYLGKLVAHYLRETQMPFGSFWEDMLQEARLAFLQHIRKMQSEADVFFCKAKVVSALQRYRERAGLMRLPKDKFRQYADRYEVVPIDVYIDEAMTTNDMFMDILVKHCFDVLNPIEHAAIELRGSGHTYQEICDQLRLSTPTQAKRIVDTATGKLYRKLREDGTDGYLGIS